MYTRVVRFTDVSQERVDGLLAQIDESDGPPEDVPIKSMQMMFDPDHGTAVVLQMFESAEDMAVGDEVFAAMDSADTPGTRSSVDMCEVMFERSLP